MKRSRTATLVGLALVAGAFVVLLIISLTNGLVYYVTPTELAERPATDAVRLYGIVEPGSMRWNDATSTVSFRVTDGRTTLTVESQSVPTGLFRDGIGVVLAGKASGPGTFAANEVLVKHSEVYEPLRPGQTLPPGLLDAIREASP